MSPGFLGTLTGIIDIYYRSDLDERPSLSLETLAAVLSADLSAGLSDATLDGWISEQG